MAVDTFWQFAHRHPLLVGLVVVYALYVLAGIAVLVLA